MLYTILWSNSIFVKIDVYITVENQMGFNKSDWKSSTKDTTDGMNVWMMSMENNINKLYNSCSDMMKQYRGMVMINYLRCLMLFGVIMTSSWIWDIISRSH
jgi:hypothetical protein